MRVLVGLALVAAVCPEAAADVAFAAHDAPIELGPQTIDVELTRFEARYTVRYEVRNPGPLPDEVTVELFTPAAAAVTGLRYQPRAGAAWLDARVLPDEDAHQRWERYAVAPFASGRGPALIELQGGLHVLRLLLVPAGDRVAVEYTMIGPVCHAAGHWFAPSPGIEVSAGARYRVRGPHGAGRRASGADAKAIAGTSLEAACQASEPYEAWSGDHLLVAEATELPATRGVDGRLVIVPAGDRRVVQVVIDTAARLAPAPRDASVVFVVDASISMGDAGVAAQLAMVKAYLARAPGARFEIVAYRRDAAPVFGRWRAGEDVARALTEVGAAPFAVANGSNLDAGLARAAALLARAPGPRRLVAFTDDLVREALDEELAKASLAGLPADTIVHAVVATGTTAARSELRRDDEHWLTPVAAAWGGIAAWATLGGDAEPAATRDEVFEELVRPRRIANVVTLEGNGTRDEVGDIVEGNSVRWLFVTEDDAVTVSGFIWGTPWQPTRVTDERAQRSVAALAIGDGVASDLEDDALRPLATRAHVVSAVTSLWADDPRWTPGGLPPEVLLEGRSSPSGIRGSTGGGFGTHSVHHTAHGRIGAARTQPDLVAFLAGPVATCATRAAMTTWNVGLEIETTAREVVDVRLLRGADDPAFARCVIERGWALSLPAEFDSWVASFEVNVLGDSARR